MHLELHLLQNFAPNCLNRDDINSPKACVFGGRRRARLSSQCCKRAIRVSMREDDLLPADDLAVRTKRVYTEAADRLSGRHGRDRNEAVAKVKLALGSVKFAPDGKKPDETQYLLFLGEREIDRLVDVVQAHWDAIELETEEQAAARKGRKGKGKKTDVPKEVATAVSGLLDGGRAADLALFGRMVADLPERNVDAASQVAHAISTHAVEMEMDYFTAVDDLKNRSGEGEDAGAGMIGTVEFNSACYYRYANLHLPQLLKNLQSDADLAGRAVEAYLRASVRAIPTGKQNSFAAHNPPSLVLAVLRRDAPVSLANAFADPVDVRRHTAGSLVAESVRRLDDHWTKIHAAYGSGGLERTAAVLVEPVEQAEFLTSARVGDLDTLIGSIVEAIDFAALGAAAKEGA